MTAAGMKKKAAVSDHICMVYDSVYMRAVSVLSVKCVGGEGVLNTDIRHKTRVTALEDRDKNLRI